MPRGLLLFLLLLPQLLLSVPRVVALNASLDLRAKLHVRVVNYTLSADNFVDALAKVATQFQLPIGIEWSENSATKRKLAKSWSDVDVQHIVQQLVSAYPGYELKFGDGVVHVFPQWTKANRQDFVNLNVPKFVVRDQMPEIASRQLRNLVKSTVSPPPPVPHGMPGGSIYSQAGEVGEQDISVDLHNATIRDALDRIALASDRKIWVVTFTDEPLTPTGFRRTRTLWIKTIAVNEQPVWDSLRWGSEIPANNK